jgi:DNA (cytosine-5)-methyltransferase 1
VNAIDLFSGAGGLILALNKSNINVVLANEINPRFAETHYHNFPNIPLLEKDIKDVSLNDITAITKGKTIDLVVGGPPCQGFSIFGKRRFINTKGYNPKNDPRNALVYEFIRIVDEVRPAFFFMENVKGFTSLDDGLFVAEIERRFKEIGYNDIWSNVVCAVDYGVPQERYRMFMIGNRIGIEYQSPAPTHYKRASGKEPFYRTVGDAIMDIVDKTETDMPNHVPLKHKEKVALRMSYVKEGARLEVSELPDDLLAATRRDSKTGKVSNYSHVYRRLDRGQPSTTMVPGHNAFPIHPTLNRTLTAREAARLQSFPDTHVFFGTRQEQCIQVGNAVPPQMAEPFIEKIRLYLEGEAK